MDIGTRKTKLLAKGRASDDMKKVLACLNSPCFSLDDKAVYFLSAAWATSNSIHRITLATKKVDFITNGNSISVIKQGQHAGSLLIDRALIKYDKQGESMGRDSYLWLFSADGKPVKEIGDSEGTAARKFLKEK